MRGVAIDGFRAISKWPGILAALGALLIALYFGCIQKESAVGGLTLLRILDGCCASLSTGWRGTGSALQAPSRGEASHRRSLANTLFIFAISLVGVAIVLDIWWLALVGTVLAGISSLMKPIFWLAALFFALPFDFAFAVPLFPDRAIGIIEFVLLGALLSTVANRLLWLSEAVRHTESTSCKRNQCTITTIVMILCGWALLAAIAAPYRAVALREWRSIFMTALILFLLLSLLNRSASRRQENQRLLFGSWLVGATVVALVAIGQFAFGTMTISAEGVDRVRAFYASPNNLALYLERTFMVAAALALFAPNRRTRIPAIVAVVVQGLALILTFSKGALFVGVPAGLGVLLIGGLWMLGRQARSTRVLWGLAAPAGVGMLLLIPFLNTPRFQQLLDITQGTGYLRLQLWRSAWQMALDHWALGVGPDNFLYIYRSEYILPTAWQEPNLNHPHNALLDWWTRLGLPGLLLGVAFWWRGLSDLVRTLVHRVEEPGRAARLLGVTAAAVAALAHGLVDVSYALPDLMLVWVLLFDAADLKQ